MLGVSYMIQNTVTLDCSDLLKSLLTIKIVLPITPKYFSPVNMIVSLMYIV